MKDYLVTWAIGITADDPKAAATEARRIQKDNDAATVFLVEEPGGTTFSVDLYADTTEQVSP